MKLSLVTTLLFTLYSLLSHIGTPHEYLAERVEEGLFWPTNHADIVTRTGETQLIFGREVNGQAIDSNEKQSWAEQAKMRANITAASYNEYILKNSFVWDGNIPKDISEKLNTYVHKLHSIKSASSLFRRRRSM